MTKAKSSATHKSEEHKPEKTTKHDVKHETTTSKKSKSAKAENPLDPDELLQSAKEQGINVPSDKEEAADVVKDLIELAREHSSGTDVDREAVLAGCEHHWGLTPEAAKKRHAAIEARAAAGKQPAVNKEPCEWPLDEKGASSREIAERLRLEALRQHIKVPEDDDDAIVLCGQAALGAKTDRHTIDVPKALQHLQDKCGIDDSKFRNLVGDVQVKGNAPIVEMLRELAASYFKRGSEDRLNRIKGAMLQRAGTAVRDLDWEITPEHMPVASGKSADKIPNVGHDTIEYIREFFETGKVTKLEENKIEDQQKK